MTANDRQAHPRPDTLSCHATMEGLALLGAHVHSRPNISRGRDSGILKILFIFRHVTFVKSISHYDIYIKSLKKDLNKKTFFLKYLQQINCLLNRKIYTCIILELNMLCNWNVFEVRYSHSNICLIPS